MKIDVSLHPNVLSLASYAHKNVVAVDVLRATSTMVCAFEKGAAGIFPVESLEEARQATLLHPKALLLGEVKSLKPEEFHFDNSPTEVFHSDMVDKRDLIMRTTNGTKLLRQLQQAGAENVYIGSFLNLAPLAQHLAQQPHDVMICCAGSNGEVNMEDTGFAGALIESLQKILSNTVLSDAAHVAIGVWQSVQGNIQALFSKSPHAKVLERLGKAQDIDFIATQRFEQIPVFLLSSGWIRSANAVKAPEPAQL